MTGAWGAWAPPLEKTQLMGIYFSGLNHLRLFFYFFLGASIGTLVIFTLAGLLADGLGWPAVFYVTGNRGFQFDLLGTGRHDILL